MSNFLTSPFGIAMTIFGVTLVVFVIGAALIERTGRGGPKR